MKILYVTQYFPPETGAGARRAYEMAAAWNKAGAEVTVVCPFPSYPEGRVAEGYRGRFKVREEIDGISVVRVPIYTRPTKTFATRIGNYASFALTGAGAAFFAARPDVVYVSSPPLPVGLAGLLTRLRGARFFFEVRDLWPESAKAVGELNDGALYRGAEAFERWCYARAEKIIVVTAGIRSRLIARGIPEGKLVLARNGANLARLAAANVAPLDEARPGLRLFYGGLLGLAQGIPAVLEGIRRLANEPDFHFTVAGAGPFGGAVAEAAQGELAGRLTMLGNLPAAEVPAQIGAADICLVPLGKDELFRGALPSKMFEAWALGRPVLLSAAGEAARLVAQTQAGIVVPPEDPGSLAEAVHWLGQNRKTLVEMAARAQEAVAAFDRERIALEVLAAMETPA